MSINTRFSEHRSWPSWPAVLAVVRQRVSVATKAIASFALRRAAQRTLLELDQLDDRLLADIGLDRTALAALMRGITKQA